MGAGHKDHHNESGSVVFRFVNLMEQSIDQFKRHFCACTFESVNDL